MMTMTFGPASIVKKSGNPCSLNALSSKEFQELKAYQIKNTGLAAIEVACIDKQLCSDSIARAEKFFERMAASDWFRSLLCKMYPRFKKWRGF